jgi:hypothetical protein
VGSLQVGLRPSQSALGSIDRKRRAPRAIVVLAKAPFLPTLVPTLSAWERHACRSAARRTSRDCPPGGAHQALNRTATQRLLTRETSPPLKTGMGFNPRSYALRGNATGAAPRRAQRRGIGNTPPAARTKLSTGQEPQNPYPTKRAHRRKRRRALESTSRSGKTMRNLRQ